MKYSQLFRVGRIGSDSNGGGGGRGGSIVSLRRRTTKKVNLSAKLETKSDTLH